MILARTVVIAGLTLGTLSACVTSSGGSERPVAPSTEGVPLNQRAAGTPGSEPSPDGIFVVTSEAMAMTLQGCQGCDDDHVLVSELTGHPHRVHDGDIVVFHAPTAWQEGSAVLVLRVMALGGETIEGVSKHGGQNETILLSEHGRTGPWRTADEDSYVYIDAPDGRANFGPITVPAGRAWVMGDHRNEAADSRAHCGPSASSPVHSCNPISSTVPTSKMIGIATKIVSPHNRIGSL